METTQETPETQTSVPRFVAQIDIVLSSDTLADAQDTINELLRRLNRIDPYLATHCYGVQPFTGDIIEWL